MSNSGIIIFEDNKELGLYLHWNGGRDSVKAFLKYCKLTKKTGGFQCGMLSLAQVIKNWSIELGNIIINPFNYNSDNGIYIVDKKWNIIDRKKFNGIEQNEYNLEELLKDLDKSQPTEYQLGEEYFNGKFVNRKDIEIGDEVFITSNRDYKTKKYKVIGTGIDKMVNGTRVKDIPYINSFGRLGYENNINNYLLEENYRVIKKNNSQLEE